MPDASGYHLLEFALLNFDESPFRCVLSSFTSINLRYTRKPHESDAVANAEFKRRCRAMKLRNTSERDHSTKLVSITQVRTTLLSLRNVQVCRKMDVSCRRQRIQLEVPTVAGDVSEGVADVMLASLR